MGSWRTQWSLTFFGHLLTTSFLALTFALGAHNEVFIRITCSYLLFVVTHDDVIIILHFFVFSRVFLLLAFLTSRCLRNDRLTCTNWALWRGSDLLASCSFDVTLEIRVKTRLNHLEVLRITHLLFVVDLSSLALAQAQEGINFDLFCDRSYNPLRDFPFLNKPVVYLFVWQVGFPRLPFSD